LDALKLQTLDLHWAESYAGTGAEHNVIVVTAKGQPFRKGIILDNWRCQGHLVYCWVPMDPQYRWKENPAELARRLNDYELVHPRMAAQPKPLVESKTATAAQAKPAVEPRAVAKPKSAEPPKSEKTTVSLEIRG
jgi:hypothetical protein